MAWSVPEDDGDVASGNQTESVDRKYVAFMLRLLRTFIMAAFSTSDRDAYQAAILVRKSSSMREGDTQQNQQPEDLQEGSSFKQLQKLLQGPVGLEIVDSVDYPALQTQVVTVASKLLKKNTLAFEDRLIVENALYLWVGCLLHREELFGEFVDSARLGVSSEEFLLSGLLYCPYESVREEFRGSLSALCKKRKSTTVESVEPLAHTLKLLASNFSLISEYPCKQYFGLFCELLDKYFLEAKLSGGDAPAIDSESLLSAVIGRIREENQKAQKARVELQGAGQDQQDLKESAGLFLGLIQLAGKILDNFADESGSGAGNQPEEASRRNHEQQKGLIDEIFTRFLFPSVFDQEQADKSSSYTMNQVIESKLQMK